MRAVDGVAALESHHVHALGEVLARLGRRLAEEVPHRPVESGQLAGHVELALLHGHHLHACGPRTFGGGEWREKTHEIRR